MSSTLQQQTASNRNHRGQHRQRILQRKTAHQVYQLCILKVVVGREGDHGNGQVEPSEVLGASSIERKNADGVDTFSSSVKAEQITAIVLDAKRKAFKPKTTGKNLAMTGTEARKEQRSDTSNVLNKYNPCTLVDSAQNSQGYVHANT